VTTPARRFPRRSDAALHVWVVARSVLGPLEPPRRQRSQAATYGCPARWSDDVFAKQARVHFLFADSSPATMASVGVTAHLRNMLMALENPGTSIRDRTVMAIYSRNVSGTQEQHVKFNQAALVALQQTWWDRLRERWELRRRSRKNGS
jgi:hypothetical protein